MNNDDQVRPFSIHVPDAVLTDLKRRLRQTRWTDEIAAEPWRYGPPLNYMKEFVADWVERYDWRAQEARLNGLRQFVTSIDGHDIHFIHEAAAGPDPLPLILTHGWPGSFVEMRHIIPMLTNPAAHGADPADAFEVVVPSIPGSGFSARPTQAGMDYSVVADLWVKLMERLGHRRFGAQGGDWGMWVSAALARQHPGRVVGLHLNYLSSRFRAGGSADKASAEEQDFVDRAARWAEAEGGYIAIQATKPLTLGYGLNDSPAGLAAWLLEKFKTWSDCVHAPEEAIGRDDLITNIMVYWVTQTAHSAARFYAGSRNNPFHLTQGEKITPPCGIAIFPAELPMPPRSYVERAFNIVRWTEAPKGGHFAALEQPAILAEDIRSFFRPLRKSR
ncbi:MAG: epoxide hydrolase family protein [Caulobacter sp.]